MGGLMLDFRLARWLLFLLIGISCVFLLRRPPRLLLFVCLACLSSDNTRPLYPFSTTILS